MKNKRVSHKLINNVAIITCYLISCYYVKTIYFIYIDNILCIYIKHVLYKLLAKATNMNDCNALKRFFDVGENRNYHTVYSTREAGTLFFCAIIELGTERARFI